MPDAYLACGLFGNFALERRERRLARLDAPSRSGPPTCAIGVAHQKNAAGAVENRSKDTECGHTREIGLTRIRLQPAIHFCLHRGSLPENTAGRQPRSGAKPTLKNFRKKLYMSD